MKILKPSDWKVWDHLEISGQFLKLSENLEIIWKYLDSFEFVWTRDVQNANRVGFWTIEMTPNHQ